MSFLCKNLSALYIHAVFSLVLYVPSSVFIKQSSLPLWLTKFMKVHHIYIGLNKKQQEKNTYKNNGECVQ